MLRIRKLCMYLDEYVKTRDLSSYTLEFQRILRNGIREDEIVNFSTYFQEKEGSGVEKDEVLDLVDQEFFQKNQQVIYTNINIIRVGWKGRELTKGNFFKRWERFIQYASGKYSFWFGLFSGATIIACIKFIWRLF